MSLASTPLSLLRAFVRPGRSVALGERGMAATSHPDATLAALDVLRAGGSAADAAIAAAAVQGVVDPHMTGVGGDCFVLYAPGGGAPSALNGSGRAPAGLSLSVLSGVAALPDDSPHAVTIPGAVAAWAALSERFGRLGLDASLQAAIRLAREGWRVHPRVARDWAAATARLARGPGREALLIDVAAPAAGERLESPALARTLTTIAEDGARGFYEGDVAAAMTARLNALGGLHTVEDFSRAQAEWTAPISAPYRDRSLVECPPNGQGLAALIIARIMSRFDLADRALSQADRVHIHAEATKAGYRLRDAIVADPAVAPADVEGILSDRSIDRLAATISMDKAAAPEAFELPDHRDTVHITVVDRDRNVCSFINSIFHSFGSTIQCPRTGVIFQNRGLGFSLKPGHPNALAPGKRPMHTIIPGLIMKEGRVETSFGVMGGQYQAAGHAQFLSRTVDLGEDPQQAAEAPRSFAHDGVLTLESTHAPETAEALRGKGHHVVVSDEPMGGCQAIRIDWARGVLIGGSDHRKDGFAVGY
jgi:gamma-glutamyltranspeptidase/glutathione hydrolase